MQSDDVGRILASLGIDPCRIVPTNVSQKFLRQKSEFSQFESDISCFPLEWFDSGGDDAKRSSSSSCREGFAFLPSSSSKQVLSAAYEWRKVSVERYNNKSNRWRIEDESGSRYEVPRIYLRLLTDDPVGFAMRIHRAVEHRANCERHLRLETVLSALIMQGMPSARSRARIEKMLSARRDFTETDAVERYLREHSIVYRKALAAQRLIKFSPRRIELLVADDSSGGRGRRRLESGKLKNLTMEECRESQRRIQQLWLYCCPQSIKIMEFINNECERVSRLSLFRLQTPSLPCCWERFRHENRQHLQTTAHLLQSQWINSIVSEIRKGLVGVGRGLFDTSVNNWFMYSVSKLRRLIALIQQRMQVAINSSLRASVRAYVSHLCAPCESLLHIADDFEWNADDLCRSPFHTDAPLFYLQLNFPATDDATPTFSLRDLESGRVQTEAIEMLKECVLMTHDVPQIEPRLVRRLRFNATHLKLSSIGLLDAELQERILHLRRCYSKCVITLTAYARPYRRYGELKSTRVLPFIQQRFVETHSSAFDVRAEIVRQTRLREELCLSVPETIVIGPFLIDTAEMKRSLIEIRELLIKHLKALLFTMASGKVASIQQRYDQIISRLAEKPMTIEQLDDIAKWIPTVATLTDALSKEMQATLTADFECIDSFALPLTDEIFTAKWRALRMPQIVSRQINETLRVHEHERERFRMAHESDTTVLAENVDELARDIDARTRALSLDDYRTVSDDIDDLWRRLRALLERAELLRRRCQIFDEPESDALDVARRLEGRLEPLMRLWSMTANFRTSRALWTEQMPLSALDVPSIEAEMRRCGEIAEASRAHFVDDEEMMGVLERVSDEMREMNEFVDTIRDLTRPDMGGKQWRELQRRTNGKVFYHGSLTTFGELLSNGILNFTDTVREILRETAEQATREQEERQRLLMAEEEHRRRVEEEWQRKILRRQEFNSRLSNI